MTGKTHLLFGLGTGCLLATAIMSDNILQGSVMIACTAVGSLFPDIDNPTSMISKKFKISSRIFNKLFGHRTFFHSPLLCILLCILLYCILERTSNVNWIFTIWSFAFGFAGHLFLDSLTKGGVPFFYPFKTKRYHFTCVKTGGIGEKIVFIGACIITLMAFIFFIYFTEFRAIEALPQMNIFKGLINI